MNKILPLAIALFWCATSVAFAQVVPPGSSWKYLDDGSDQGTAWSGVGFDDSTWAAGPAQLGYGEGDEATVVSFGPDEDNKYVTTYFRHSFQVANPADFNQLALGLLRDDGAVVYLNGTQVFRNNLPAGSPDYLTFASDFIDGHLEHKWIWKSLNPALLVTGTNVLAVEIHQATLTSSDISFDCTLDQKKLIEPGMLWRYLDDGSDQGTAWAQPSFDATSWRKGPSKLGYGEGDELTELGYGGDIDNKYPTTYFRGEFEIVDALQITDLTMGVNRDDGAIVYLNGIEIWRDNMPAGPVDFLTYALDFVDNSYEQQWHWSMVDPALLVAGTNVVAVEIHQVTSTSSDIGLNLELKPLPFKHLIRKPYVQNLSEHSAVMRWRTAFPESSLVEFGLAPGALTLQVFDPTPVTDHEVTLTGLATDNTYYYSVGSDVELRAGDDIEHNFTTFPATGQPSAARVWVLGDSGTATSIQTMVRDAYLQWTGATPTDLMLLLGDNAYNDGTDFEYQIAFFDIYTETIRQVAAYSTRGNHERDEAVYYSNFSLPTQGEAGGLASGTEAYYSFDYANIHFVCLDSYLTSRLIGDPMYAWLENDLATTSQDWMIAFWHHPPYTKGSHDSDLLEDSGGAMVEMRERFLPLLESNGVDLVLSGHSHSYERSYLIDGHYDLSLTWDPSIMLLDSGDGNQNGNGAYVKPYAGHAGAVYTVAGSSGKVSFGDPLNHPAMFRSLEVAGSVVLDVLDDRLDLSFINSAGEVDDSFTMIKRREGPFLGMKNLTAGEHGKAVISNLTPGNITHLGFSIAGPGPTPTPLGLAQLSHPITKVQQRRADATGEVQIPFTLPPHLLGAVLYSQAVEVLAPGIGSFSNPRADVIQ
jgi:hypothetical protein